MSDPASILVVDDSPTARRTTENTLAQAGYHVITADDGEDALNVFASQQPDAVILDIVLPKKNGFQVCRQLKAETQSDAKVLMLTSKSQESDRIWGQRQGADDYLTKPYEPRQLLDSLQQLLSGS
ncbi:MAG: response regulator [Planctomycetota bacterium]